MMIARMCLAISISLVVAVSCFADVGPTKLETLMSLSDYIVVGKVAGVINIDERLAIAELEITQTLKGDPKVSELYYQVSRKSLEDTSDAHLGETALLFLRQPHNVSPTAYPKAIQQATHGTPLFYISHAGRGRLVPIILDGASYVYARRAGSIIFPDGIPVKWGSDPSDPELGLIRMDDVIRSIADHLRRNDPVH